MFKKWMVLIVWVSFLLAACHSPVYNQSESNVADAKIETDQAFKKSDADAEKPKTLKVDKGAYIDKTPISLHKNPQWLNNRIVIRGDQLPFSYYTRVIGRAAGKHILTKYQVGLDESAKISMNYSGTVKGAINTLASKAGYVYSVAGRKIYWKAFVTRSFDIAFMPGATDYLMGKKSGSSGSGGSSDSGSGGEVSDFSKTDSSNQEYSSLSGKLSVWDDLQAAVNQMLSPQGRVTVSQATTTVTVKDRPTNVDLIGQYIHNLNKKLSRQVLVKVQVLEVDLQNDYNFGLDWSLIAKSFKNSNFVLNGNYGTPVSINALSSQTFSGTSTPQFGTEKANAGQIPGYTILFNALNQQGKTSIVSEPRVVCLNNQVSVVRIVEQEGYVASVQNTTLGGSSSTSAQQNTVTSQVTPGTVITGLTLYILPKILKDKIYMQVNADLSTLKSNEFVGSSSSSQIQVPNVALKHFNQRSMIRSGDTLILSGFRQLTNRANANQFLKSQALGGKGSTQESVETVVLITPILLHGAA